jgi:hypothetical protein
MECPDAQPNNLSRSLVALDQDTTLIAVVEMSEPDFRGRIPSMTVGPFFFPFDPDFKPIC